MKNSFFMLVSVVEVVVVIVDVVLVTVVDDVEVVVGLKSNGSPVSLSEGSAKSIGSSWKFIGFSAKSIGSSWKSIDDELSLLELFKYALSATVTCVSF